MATGLKRMTFILSQEIEKELDFLKQEIFYMNTQSYMIRELIALGTCAAKGEKEAGCSVSSKAEEKTKCSGA